ncbi:thioesterase II family protein [Kitasatospora sp. NPDC057223]|uniref:thioesterase II family protein n=1 Tax=Kitasatospora sp. NPDC057223 TaxID=3346055 RepID=UPI00363C9517
MPLPPHPATSSAPVVPSRTWTRTFLPRPGARLRLFCFHSAGGGPSMYRDWPARLPADIEVVAVQLPGRETSIGEPWLTDYQEVVDQLHAALRPQLDRPYALFGHSMGALLAYGVALAALRCGDRPPGRLLVSGSAGPGAEPSRPDRADWPDAELVEDLRSMGGTPEEVLASRELLDLILPALRADYAVCRSFRHPDEALLDCPVSVLGGLEDSVSLDGLHRWSGTTRAATSVRTFPGGHFFLTGESAPGVLAAVTQDLAAPQA